MIHERIEPPVPVRNRTLSPGDEVYIIGERGAKFTFVDAYQTEAGKLVLNFVGGPRGHYAMRSFYPERVKFIPMKRKAK